MNKPSLFALILLLSVCTPARAQSTFGLPKMSGFAHVRYQYNGATDAGGFDVRRARLDFRGDVAPAFGYRLQVDFVGTPKILDAYLQWKPTGSLALQAGQFKIPFSMENAYAPTALETVDNSLAITALSGYNDVSGVSANGRDVGVMAGGGLIPREGFCMVEWSVGVFNGTGINKADNNKQKDVSGIVTLRPTRHLSVAGYHYNGHAAGADGEATIRRLRTGGGVKYDDGRWLARGEYLWGRTGVLRSRGAYGVVGLFVHPKVQTVLKYDLFTRDVTDRDTRQIYYTAGVNYLPVKNIKLQLNYSYRTSPAVAASHYAVLQLLGMF